MSNVEAEPEPTELSKTWRYKATNLRVLAHVKQKGNAEDKKVGKSWELLAEGILELCAEIDRLTAELKAKDEEIKQLKVLLKVALCPNIQNGCKDGVYPDPYGQPCRCQWCDEVEQALKGEQKSETS